MAVLEGKDPAKKIASSYSDILTANWTVWPAVQTLNFKFVPLEGRVLVVNLVSLGEFWGYILLVWVAGSEVDEKKIMYLRSLGSIGCVALDQIIN